MLTKKSPKIPHNFSCEVCDYYTSNKKDIEKHLLTAKHKKLTSVNNLLTENPKKENEFMCAECNKTYKSRVGLWKHSKTCVIEYTSVKNEYKDECKDIEIHIEENNLINSTKDIIMLLIKENNELKTMMIEQQNKMIEQQNKMFEQQNLVLEIAKNGTHNTTNTHTNSHNKAFNLNFFLNETCKDAMNITDFVDSIKLQLSDLERVGELGYVEGISNIIVQNLKELDITQRPVHCTDKKRDTIYVKDENKWEKDDENKKMHKMVRKVKDKNFKMIQKFKEKYPDYNKASSRHSDTYNNIIIESMGGRGDNDFEKEERIIKKVSKEIVVEK